jgi:hypothetical protein
MICPIVETASFGVIIQVLLAQKLLARSEWVCHSVALTFICTRCGRSGVKQFTCSYCLFTLVGHLNLYYKTLVILLLNMNAVFSGPYLFGN